MHRAGAGARSDDQLLGALVDLRDRAAEARLPLALNGADRANRDLRALVGQLDDYVLPRLREFDAPILGVVGGSTGAGKSTLVNSLVGAEVSAPGVLRPTTRHPVLACHPSEVDWFVEQRILLGLPRTTGAAGAREAGPPVLHIVPAETAPTGIALLDAPDIDSVVTQNRELAAQLMAAADLWIFVTTAARYADAVPWEFLIEARTRAAAVSVVLNRVAPEAVDEVSNHLARMLTEHGLGEAPLFTVPESQLDAAGMLPASALEPIQQWLTELASDAEQRSRVIRQTLNGTLDGFRDRLADLAEAADAQAEAIARLRGSVATAYEQAVARVDAGVSDGTLLRGEVLARWQEFVGTGELLKSLQSQVGRIRDRVTAFLRGTGPPETELTEAIESGVEALIRSAADDAAEQTVASWRAAPAGRALLDSAGIEVGRAGPDLPERAAKDVRAWQGQVLDLVRERGASKRVTARFLAFGVNGVGILVMIAVFAQTAGLTGAEIGVAAGTGVISQKLLEAIFGDQAVRELAAEARRNLSDRVHRLLDEDADRFTTLLDDAGMDPSLGNWLRAQSTAIDAARGAPS